MGTPTYATREAVKLAAEQYGTLIESRIDQALEEATDDINRALRRKFYPIVATRYFSWPPADYSNSYTIRFAEDEEFIEVTSVVSDGVAIDDADYFLEPVNQGPPYTWLELNRGTNAAFSSGATNQRQVAIAGTLGYKNETSPAGTLAAAPDATTTTLDVSDASLVGVGDLLNLETERAIVTGRSWLTSGQALQTPVTANLADVTLAVTNGAGFHVGELLLLDAERMQITDIAGNNLVVKRQRDSTVLAAHTGSTIYTQRRLTVERGALGTTAAAHANALAVTRQRYPRLIQQLCRAVAIDNLMQDSSAWSRTIGSGDNERQATGRALQKLWADAMSAYGRQMRHAAV